MPPASRGWPDTCGHPARPEFSGTAAWQLTGRLFHAALPPRTVLAQIAIVIFMFVVGYELDRRSLHRLRHCAPLVAAATLLVPMALGCGAALLLRSRFADLGQQDSGRSFVMFIGVVLSITALPVLAAILRECGIAGSVAGVTATAAAGIMDVAAWLVLAVALVGTAHQTARPGPVTALLIWCFAAFMLLAVRPASRWRIRRRGPLRSHQLVVALALALGSAWVTAALGLHPVFGGFLADLTMPSADGTRTPRSFSPWSRWGPCSYRYSLSSRACPRMLGP
ncbi:MAG TPA: cation:proton antiporter [Streptosporangiaceae bacterium]